MRKKILALMIIASLGVASVGCSQTESNQTSSESSSETSTKTETTGSKKVVVGVYSGDWENTIKSTALDRFEEETGIEVEVVPGADTEWYTKLKAANGKNVPYDVLILQPDTIQKSAASGLLQELDSTNVPNVDKLYKSVSERFTYDGALYAAGFSMGQLGIAYRKDLVKNPPTSWADLYKEEYKGHVAISPLTYSAGLQFFFSQMDNGDVNTALEKMKSLKENVVAYPDGAGAVQTLLERGDAWITPFWDGRAFAWQESGLDIGFVYPSDGPVAAIASWTIAKNAPNLENAYKLVDYLSSAEVQGAFADVSFYGMSNSEVTYSDAFLSKAHVGEDYYNQLSWVDYELATPNLQTWVTEWQKIMGQ